MKKNNDLFKNKNFAKAFNATAELVTSCHEGNRQNCLLPKKEWTSKQLIEKLDFTKKVFIFNEEKFINNKSALEI